jgi:hypothetical protein
VIGVADQTGETQQQQQQHNSSFLHCSFFVDSLKEESCAMVATAYVQLVVGALHGAGATDPAIVWCA